MARLTLTEAARVNPLQVGESQPTPTDNAPSERVGDDVRTRRTAPGTAPAPRNGGNRRRLAAAPPVPRPAFAAVTGRPRQTALRLDADLIARLEQTARAAGTTVSGTALTVAALAKHMPPSAPDAVRAIAERLAARLRDGSRPTQEINIRLPDALRARLDELVREAKHTLPAASRSALVSAILAEHLPPEAEPAAALVLEHRLAQLPLSQPPAAPHTDRKHKPGRG